jgi:ketosteroid isomerase-like protein
MEALSMKLIFSLLAAVAIALIPSVFGQQMVSPPGNIGATPEPAAEATPETTRAPAAAAEEPTVEATRSVEPGRAEPAATPVLPVAEKKTSPSRPATKSAKPRSEPQTEAPAAKAPKKARVEANLKEMENKWEAAIMAHDASVVDALVAADFSGINSKGRFINKAGLMAELKEDSDTYKSARNDKLNVRVYGPSTAVVTGSARARGTTKEGKVFDRVYRFTDTWVERDGQWQCVASQDSILPQRR